MNQGRIFAALLGATTVALVVIGTAWPVQSAVAYAGGQGLLRSSSTPEEAVRNLGNDIRDQAWEKAYARLANKAQFTEPEFVHDLTGYYPSLRTYATLENLMRNGVTCFGSRRWEILSKLPSVAIGD